MNEISLASRLAIALWNRGDQRIGQFIENALGKMYPCAGGVENQACIFNIPDETFVNYLEDYAASLRHGSRGSGGVK